jgi:hypothetical protein
MFRYFKLASTVLGSFSVILLVCALIGALGIFSLSSIRDSFNEMAAVRVPSIDHLHAIGNAMLAVDAAENALLATDLGEKQRRSIYLRFDELQKDLAGALSAYESLPQSADEARLWQNFVPVLERWWHDHEELVRLAREYDTGRSAGTYKAMSAQALAVSAGSLSTATALLDEIIGINQRLIEEGHKSAGTMASSYQNYIVATVFSGTGLSLAIGAILSINLVRRSRRYGRRLVLDVRQPLFQFSPAKPVRTAQISCPSSKVPGM